jgi:hypothetical protein
MIRNESPFAYVAQSNPSSVNANNMNKFQKVIEDCETDRLKKGCNNKQFKVERRTQGL